MTFAACTTEGRALRAEQVTSIICSLIAWRTEGMHKDRISHKPVLWIELCAENEVKYLWLKAVCHL